VALRGGRLGAGLLAKDVVDEGWAGATSGSHAEAVAARRVR